MHQSRDKGVLVRVAPGALAWGSGVSFFCAVPCPTWAALGFRGTIPEFRFPHCMRFEYEITADDYVRAQVLYHKHRVGWKRFRTAGARVVFAVVLFLIAFKERAFGWGSMFLVYCGLLYIYSGILSVFPARHFRRYYRRTELAGKRFEATVDEGGIEAKEEFFCMTTKWAGVKLKAESDLMFIYSASDRIFMFGKQYLSSEQQQDLRKLSGLVSVSD